MRRIAVVLSCFLTLCAAGVAAQTEPVVRGTAATEADVLCAGMMTPENIPYDMYVISGEQADPQTIYSRGQYVYLNKGSAAGVKVDDEFMVLRPERDFLHVQFYDQEHSLARSLGTQWADIGRLRVVVVQPNVSIARITYSCTYVQRGDYVRPAVDYPTPPFRPLKDLDRFAPPSGKAQGRVVRAKNYQAMEERSEVVYVNLTGVKVGDYIRFFRTPAPQIHAIYQIGGMADHVFGFGKTPQRWRTEDLPRQVLGEGVVLRTTPTSASVLVYNALREINLGDYVEIEATPPVTLECAVGVADPLTVDATSGAPVTITVRAAASDNGPITYSYDVSGGRIEGSGSQVKWNYAGLPAGTYTISPKATSGKLAATCPAPTVALTAAPAAPPAPKLVCSVRPSTPVYAGEYVDMGATATDPKGNALPYPVTYQWRTSGGTVEGSGANVRLNTTGLAAGDYSVTARAEGKGGVADCSAPVSVKNIELAREIVRCVFKRFSASVTNACKNPPLDGVPPRFQQFPGATLVVEATADPAETHESASKAMNTKGKPKITPEQLAKDRAQNVKNDLVKRLGLPESAIETHAMVGKEGAGAANDTTTITLVPQGAKYERKRP